MAQHGTLNPFNNSLYLYTSFCSKEKEIATLWWLIVLMTNNFKQQGKQGSQQNPDQERAQEDAKRYLLSFLAEYIFGFWR